MAGDECCSFVVGETADGIGRVAVFGELDAASSPSLCSALELFAEKPDVHVVVVDVSGLEFIDSSGLSAIVRANQSLGERTGATICVTGAEGTVLRAFELTGLDTFLAAPAGE